MKPSSTLGPHWLELEALAPRLMALVRSGRAAAARRGRPLLASLTLECPPVAPLSIFRKIRGRTRAFWHQADEDMAMAAAGHAVALTGSGEARFEQVDSAYRRLVSEARLDIDPSYPFAAPMALGGFAFEPAAPPNPAWKSFPDALLIVPRLLFVRAGNAGWCTINLQVSSDEDPEVAAEETIAELAELTVADEEPIGDEQPALWTATDDGPGPWAQQVESIIQAIRHGDVQKVVLARQLRLRGEGEIKIDVALRRLVNTAGHCVLFAIDNGSACMVGATPERLVRLQGTTVQVDCLAGSTARGDTTAADRRFGEALLRSDKDRREHGWVVRALREALSPYCSSLNVPDVPSLLRLPDVQHLHTPLQGTLPAGCRVLDLVARLHPTPGVGGVPRAAALEVVRRLEGQARGWYAGPIGWVDGNGGGEFVVGIRSALVSGSEARLYAGCGIVEGSDPLEEYEESCLKLRPMLTALSGMAS